MEGENHQKGIHYSDYFFLLAILFIFLILFFLICVFGIIATRWSYRRRTKEKLDEEKERHRKEEEAWKECERRFRNEAERKNERALERELRKKYEEKESKPHTTVIKMEPPITPSSVSHEPAVRQPVCNHQQIPSNGQPLVQTFFVPQPYFPPPPIPQQYFQPQSFQNYQTYLGQQLPPPPKPEESKQPSSKRTPKDERKQMEKPVAKDDVTIDVEVEDSSSALPTLSDFSGRLSRLSQSEIESEVPCFSTDVESRSKSPKKMKKHGKKDPWKKRTSSTTITETNTITETLASSSGNTLTPSIPITRTVTRTMVKENAKMPKTWQKRSPSITTSSAGISKHKTPTSSVAPSSQSSSLTETEAITDVSITPITSRTSTVTTPTEASTSYTTTKTPSYNASTTRASPEITQRTQSPKDQSPTISVEMPVTNIEKRKIIGFKPKAASRVAQVLAKHQETKDWRLPNQRYELDYEKDSPQKASLSPETTSNSSQTSITPSSTISNPQADLFPIAQITASSLSIPPEFPKKLAESNDPFLTNNPYWRSRAERETYIQRLRSPNTGRINGIEVTSKETALWLPMSQASPSLRREEKFPAELHRAQIVEVLKSDKTQESSPELRGTQVGEVLKSDKTQESPPLY